MAVILKRILIAMLLVVVFVSFLYGLYLQYTNKIDIKITGQTAVPVVFFPDTDCRADLAACTVNLADRQLQFSVPKKAKYLQLFPVKVVLTGFNKKVPESVSVKFEMQKMNMGLNQLQLSAGQDGWYGNAMLPLCASGRSDWNAIVDVNFEGKTYRAIFALLVVAKE